MNKAKPLLKRGLLPGSEPLTRELCQRVRQRKAQGFIRAVLVHLFRLSVSKNYK